MTTGKLAADAVTTAKIADANVTSEKLGATIAARAYRTAAFNITGGGGEEKIVLDTESFDTGSDFDTANGRFVAPVTGYYHIDAALRLTGVAVTSAVLVYIYVNGSAYTYGTNYTVTANDNTAVHISTVAFVTAGQYIEMYGDCSTTEPISTGPLATFMAIYFVGV